MTRTVERSEVLDEIARYCRQAGLAESTFGRRAVNDGKLVGRIRDGGRISLETWNRIRSFIDQHPPEAMSREKSVILRGPGRSAQTVPLAPVGAPRPVPAIDDAGDRKFRFFDNRQKYLLFVNTCSEKWVIADRVSLELSNIRPRPPALRLFDAGIGDGTVLSRVMRAMHHRFPTMPFYVSGKEVSLEDIRLTLEKMPDRLFEHPATVLVLTNLYYSESPWLTTRSSTAASRFVWKDYPLQGNSAHDFEQQIADLHSFLSENWQARIGHSGNPLYDRPVVLVIYRHDHKFLLDPIIPRPGAAHADFDLIIASQPYRARSSAEFKARMVVAPLTRALGAGGRLLGIHSHGHDPGMEIIHRIWPDDHPFRTDRHQILKAVKKELGPEARNYNFNAYSDNRSIFRFDMHTLPNEVTNAIGTSTLFAAWNAAIYVAQVEDSRLEQAAADGSYLAATRDVLKEYGGLWFHDESYVISRRRD